MKKLFCFALLALLLSSTAYASVGYQKDGDPEGTASKINIEGGYTDFDGSTLTLFANGYAGGVTDNVSTESNLTSAALAYGVVKLAIGSTKYITLANGEPGQMITFIVTTAGGGTVYITDDKVDGTTGAALLATGWDDIALTELNDSVTLLYLDDTYGWLIVGQYGATVT